MERLDLIKSIDFLEVGKTYKETSSDYYLAKCLNINPNEQNDGILNFNTATFEITTHTGRKVETCTKKFYLNN